MKMFRFFMALIPVLVLFSSCEENVPAPEIQFKEYEVTLEPDGGSVTLTYQIANSVDGEKITASCDADWLTVDASTVRRMKLEASTNETGETRTADVTVSYPGAEDVVLHVTQGNFENPLKISISEITATTVVFSITTSDPELTWIPMIAYKEGFDTFASVDEVVEYDIEYFKYLADRQEEEMTLQQFLETMLAKGSLDNVTIDRLTPSTEYVLYAYGLTSDGKRTTDLVSESFTTSEPHEGDISFTITAEENDFILEYSIVPSHTGVPYYYGVATADEIDQWKSLYGDDIRTAIQKGEIDASIEKLMEYDMVESVENYFNLYTESDVMDYGYHELKADTKYVIFASKWNEQCQLIGPVTVYEHTSAARPLSENKITLEVKDVSQSSAMAVTTVTNDDPYTVIPVKAADIEGMTDEEIIEYVIEGYDYILDEYTATGNSTRIYNMMHADTDYVMLAFGYKARVMTTSKLQKVPFRTLTSGRPEDCVFTFEIEPGVEEAWVKVTPSDKGLFYHWFVYPSYYTVENAENFIKDYIKFNYDGDAEAFASWELSLGEETVTVWDLYPETEYKIGYVIMDYYTGEFLTELAFTEPFTTLAKTYADITFNFEHDAFYDLGELIDAGQSQFVPCLEDGDAILPVSLTLKGDYSAFYYNIYPNDLSDEVAYVDETFYAALEGAGCPRASSFFIVPYDKTVTLCALAYDTAGNPTKIYRETMWFSRDEASPASEYISKYIKSKSMTYSNMCGLSTDLKAPYARKDLASGHLDRSEMQARHEKAMAAVEELRKEKLQKQLQEAAFNRLIFIAR